tara:strand:+ start:275 stop:622 length:348 start_codon:yes stop_codon:yes gene_type:complete
MIDYLTQAEIEIELYGNQEPNYFKDYNSWEVYMTDLLFEQKGMRLLYDRKEIEEREAKIKFMPCLKSNLVSIGDYAFLSSKSIRSVYQKIHRKDIICTQQETRKMIDLSQYPTNI